MPFKNYHLICLPNFLSNCTHYFKVYLSFRKYFCYTISSQNKKTLKKKLCLVIFYHYYILRFFTVLHKTIHFLFHFLKQDIIWNILIHEYRNLFRLVVFKL